KTYCFTKYSGMDAMLVAIHQYQLSIFLRAISHMAVNAVADANASAHGMAPGNSFFNRERTAIRTIKNKAKNKSCCRHSLAVDFFMCNTGICFLSLRIHKIHP